MASLLIAAAGSAIGASIGGSFAASIGWTVGSMLGAHLFAPAGPHVTQEGPRLGDNTIMSGAAGQSMPRVYGAARVAGHVIWAGRRIETRHEETQSGGGKGGGGGGGSVTQVSYSYSQSFAVALSDGEIAGIRRIWANGKLIYNMTASAGIATLAASITSAAAIRVHLGTEDQTADSTLQTAVGAANCPAYRGTAYVVFDTLQLAEFGNHIPNLEFEVIGNAVTATVVTKDAALPSAQPWYLAAYDGYVYWVGTQSGPAGGGKVATSMNGTTWYDSPDGRPSLTYQAIGVPGWGIFFATNDGIWRVHFQGGRGYERVAAAGEGIYSIAYDPVTRTIWAPRTVVPEIYTSGPLGLIGYGADVTFSTEALPSDVAGYYPMGIAAYNDVVVLLVTGVYTPGYTRRAGVWATNDIDPSVYVDRFVIAGNGTGFMAYDSAGSIWIGDATGMNWTLSPTALPYFYTRPGAYLNGWYCLPCEGGFSLTQDGINLESSVPTLYSECAAAGAGFFFIPVSTDDRVLTCLAGSTPSAKIITSIVDPALSDVVEDICTRCPPLTAADIDVIDLIGETVSGYVVSRSTARAQLQTLMQAYYFDAVESDGKIKFVMRGGAVAGTIDEDDMAAHEYGSEPPPVWERTRKDDLELPIEIAIQYSDINAHYQVGSQRAQRTVPDSESRQSINMAISTDADHARQIAEVLLYDAWTSRTAVSFSTSWKHLRYEPTDVVTVTVDGVSHTVRLVDDDFAAGINRRAGVFEDSSIYTQSATSAPALEVDDDVIGVPVTLMYLLDIPLLRDQDDGVGFYAVAAGLGDGWTGCQTFKSSDSGATWVSYGAGILNAATIGNATTVLGDFSRNIFDEKDSVTVILLAGELSSDTEANVLNGANVALLGDEIIQFRDAELTADNTYVLTGLLRGRRGTEWATGTHAIGERFILLTSAATTLMIGASAEYDLTRLYKAVSFRGYLDDAPAQPFANGAVSLIPYAPVLLGGGRDAGGDITLHWTRRSRLQAGWNNYADVPLGEAAEAYTVRIYTTSSYATVARTITGLTSATTTYTAVEQTADFGSPQSTIYWDVCQISATIGDGYYARGST